MIWSLILVLLCPLTWTCISTEKLFWTVQRLPIIIGGNVTLFCDTSSIQETKVTWMKKSDVIVHHGLVFYPLKYLEHSSITGSFLTIIYTGVDDINVSYTCISDVFSFDAILKLNESNYIVLPNQQSTGITWSLNGNTGVNISFQHIYPMPECELLHNCRCGMQYVGETEQSFNKRMNGHRSDYTCKPDLTEILLSTTYSSNSHMTDIFYKDASISLKNTAKICGGNIKLRCTLMGLMIGAGSKNVLPACNEKHSKITTVRNIPESVFLFLSIAAAVFVTTCIAVAVCLIRGKRKALLKPENEENNQMQMPLNSLPL